MEANNNTKYKFRAECTADAQAVRAVLLPWLMEWQETRANLNLEGVLHTMPDVDVEFTIAEEGLSFDEMLWLLDGIDNCHVVADTLATIDNYTGEREFRATFDAPAKRPGNDLLRRVLVAVRTRQKLLNLELERTLNLHRTYDAASRLGDKWQPFNPDKPRPGWVVVALHEPSGLTSIRRIGPHLGCKKLPKQGDGTVEARMATINA